MKRIKIQIPFGGFYESIHDAQVDNALVLGIADDSGELTKEQYDVMSVADIDYKAIYEEYAEEYVYEFGEKFDVDVEFDQLESPKYYNFSTDRIFATIDEKDLQNICDEVYSLEEWHDLVEEKFTPASGWIPHYDSDSSHEDWTRPELDECQYGFIIEVWLEYVQGTEDIDYELMLENVIEFGSVQDAIELIERELEKS